MTKEELLNRIKTLEKENAKLQQVLEFKNNKKINSSNLEKELKLSEAVEQSANTVIITDINGNIEYVNEKFVQLTEYSRSEVIGSNPSILKSGKHKDKFYKNLWKTINSGKQWYGEFKNLKKNGDTYWESATISPIFNKSGKIINFIALKEDISKKKDIEKALKIRNIEFKKLNRNYKVLNKELLSLNVKLKEQSNKFIDIFNIPNECIFIQEIETGIITEVNHAITSMFGYLHSEIIGSKFDIFNTGFKPYRQKDAEEKIRNTIKVGNQTFEWLTKKKNGELFWVEVILKIGKIRGKQSILGLIKDISKRKEQEKILIESEERFRAIFENSPDIIIFTQVEGEKTISVNKTFTRITGFSSEDVNNKSAKELNIWVDENEHNKLQLLLSKKKSVDNFEALLKKKSGELYHALISIRLISINGVKHIIQIIHDISNRKKTEYALKESEEKFKELADLSPTAIFIYQDSKFVYVNNATTKITGYLEKELLKMHFWDVVHPDMQNIVKERALKRFKNQDAPNRYELKLQNKEGKTRWVDFSATSINFNGKAAGIGNVFDITDIKKAGKALIKAKKKAEESDRLKSSFLANMSHEIRTPMNGIIGFSELLANPELTPQLKEKYIKIIHQSSDQLLHIINDILDISKIEASEVKISKSKFNINSLLSELNTMFLSHLKKETRSIKLLLTAKLEEQYEIIYSDKFRIHQILTNLLSNALKFTEKGSVEFGCYYIPANKYKDFLDIKTSNIDRILFFVKDTGQGITADKQEVIFNRFRQSDDSITRKYGGTGLGLSIVKGLVNLFNGDIYLKSEPKIGSTFYFTLPYFNDI